MGKIDELVARLGEINSRLRELDKEYEGVSLPEDVRAEWKTLRSERKTTEETVKELRFRKADIADADGDDDRADAPFQTSRPGAVKGDDIYDLSTVRARLDNPAAMRMELQDRAMRSVELASFPQLEIMRDQPGREHVPSRERAQAHIERIVRRTREAVPGEVARLILTTGSPTYRRAFAKYCAGQMLNGDEQRALALGAVATGGAAVVYTLDPSIVPTSNFSVNPFRAVARIETISGTNEWKAVTSGAITASYVAEGTEATDNAPTLAQPDLIAEKAHAFVPFSIELGQDWGALEAEMGTLFQDAKDDREADKFAVGAGHGSFEPKGIITAATATTTAGGAAAFAIADLYKVLEALPPRYRPRAQWMGNLFTFDKVRQFDTAGGSGVWQEPAGLGGLVGTGGAGTIQTTSVPRIVGKSAWESTAMAAVLTTGSKILVVGDWRYFVIVDRVGMAVEVIQNLVGTNRRPTGQRGLYAYWRNTSDALSAAAFQVLVTG